jgi:hypothetical protein
VYTKQDLEPGAGAGYCATSNSLNAVVRRKGQDSRIADFEILFLDYGELNSSIRFAGGCHLSSSTIIIYTYTEQNLASTLSSAPSNMLIYAWFFLSLCSAQIIPFDQILPILTNPVVQVKAGEELHYQ